MGWIRAVVLSAILAFTGSPAYAAKPMPAPKIKVGVQGFHQWDALGDLNYSQANLGRGNFPKSGFRVSRVNIYITGDATDTMGFYVLLDPAQYLTNAALTVTSTVIPGPPSSVANSVHSTFGIINQAYVYYEKDWFKLSLGQMKVPVSAEFLQSPISLPTVELSAFATRANSTDFGNYFDVGAMTTLNGGDCGTAYLGVFNGAGANIQENNPKKIGVVRYDIKPIDQLKLGLSYLNGFKQGSSTVAGALFRNRHGADIEVKLAPVKFNAEALYGVDDGKTENPKFGWYGQAIYTVTAEHEVVAKFEGWNPDYKTGLTGAMSLQQYSALVGWNWYLGSPGTKFQLNYVHDFLPEKTGAMVGGFLPGGANDRVLSQIQVVL